MTGSQNIGLFDLDGSLANYEAAIMRDLELLRAPCESEEICVFGDGKPPHIRARVDMIRRQPGWWENLPVIESGVWVLELALYLGFECHVLTKGPHRADHAWSEKVRWCKKHLPPEVSITITENNIDPNKSKNTVYGKFLFDDFPPYVKAWLEHRPRGLVIMPDNGANDWFQHPNVLHYYGTPMCKDNVQVVLEQVVQREANEPLKLGEWLSATR